MSDPQHAPRVRASAARDVPHASADAIEFHYGVGTEFYRLWLDPDLTYSAALWESPAVTLDDDDAHLHEAQLRKLDFAAACSGAQGARRVLDIGCGWGSLLQRLVQVHAVEQATGLTLSPTQAKYARALDPRHIRVELQSYLDHQPEHPYDALCCIGAFEHFARPELDAATKLAAYREFFDRCHALLVPGGRMYLQTCAYGDSERADDRAFLPREVFPDSELPRLWEICHALDRRFEMIELRNDREHYERTLKVWDRRLHRRRAHAIALTSDATVARYRKYLRLAAIGFHTGSQALYRLCLRRTRG